MFSHQVWEQCAFLFCFHLVIFSKNDPILITNFYKPFCVNPNPLHKSSASINLPNYPNIATPRTATEKQTNKMTQNFAPPNHFTHLMNLFNVKVITKITITDTASLTFGCPKNPHMEIAINL